MSDFRCYYMYFYSVHVGTMKVLSGRNVDTMDARVHKVHLILQLVIE